MPQAAVLSCPADAGDPEDLNRTICLYSRRGRLFGRLTYWFVKQGRSVPVVPTEDFVMLLPQCSSTPLAEGSFPPSPSLAVCADRIHIQSETSCYVDAQLWLGVKYLVDLSIIQIFSRFHRTTLGGSGDLRPVTGEERCPCSQEPIHRRASLGSAALPRFPLGAVG